MTRQRAPYLRVGGLGLLALTVALSGCDRNSATPASQPSQPANPSATAAPTADLAKFYSQKLTWQNCQDHAKCTQLTVPIDYAKPGGATIKIAVLKAPATGKRKGSLVVNPGGPGGSGVDYAAAADYIVTPQVRKAYDIVGFDPRGVQRSAPITCLDDKALDKYLGSDQTPDDAAEQTTFMNETKGLADACKAKAGPLLGHVSTVEAAKDMDVLRAAIGSTKLDYLGKSYGTFLGSTYADLFPKKVGRFVLDGVVSPDQSNTQLNKGQAQGFELATHTYVKHCVAKGSCPLGDTEAAGMQKIRDFLASVDQQPIKVTKDPDVKQLTEGWAAMGIAAAMYDQNSWDGLTTAFRSAFAGDGDPLMKLADSYADRNSDGSYSGNIMQVINAVTCLDRPAAKDASSYAKDAADFSKTAPTWGPMLAWGTAVCASWPVPATGKPHKITAAGSGSIVVIGTTRDPATPYASSQELASMLQNGHLITFVGDGHTAYGRSNDCVDGAVDAYLLDGKVPADNLRC